MMFPVLKIRFILVLNPPLDTSNNTHLIVFLLDLIYALDVNLRLGLEQS